MSLAPGFQIGHYTVLAAIGAGGMGEVYRARDTALDRDVALKILPESVAADPDRLMRFTREAKTLASLNHPNIAHIYGVEARALVMELVEGEDLSERIARGAMPLDEVLPIATQIAHALQAAHEQGIIHRDLKPANIKVRDDGTVKVLDFGLAKALDPNGGRSSGGSAGPDGPASAALTMTSPALTAMGLILGTAAYMAPEQARGRSVNRRADVWAFGVVLFEMLSGRRAFAGDDISITLANVLKDDVEWGALPAHLPAAMTRLLRRCLTKDPAIRLDSMTAVRLELDEAATSPGPVTQSRPLQRRWPWAIAAAAGLALVALAAVARPWESDAAAPSFRLRVQAGFVGEFADNLRPALAISPDGMTMVHAVTEAPNQAPGLYVRRLDQLTATLLSGTEGGSGPFFSPNGQQVGFFAKGRVFTVPVAGGAAKAVADSQVGRGATWGEDDVITYTPLAASGGTLFRVSATGAGTPEPLGPMPDGHVTQRWPQALPGNRAVLYTTAPTVDNFDEGCLVAQTLDGALPRVLQCGGSFWTYVASGHVLYVHAGTVFAAPFDVSQLAVTGAGVPVLEGVESSAVSGVAQFAVSRDGVLVYLSGAGRGADVGIDIVDRQGTAIPLPGPASNWLSLTFSPEGRRLAIEVVGAKSRHIAVHDFTNRTTQRVTFGDVSDSVPVWTPNGQRLTFASATGGAPNIFWQHADGGAPERLTTSALPQFPGSWHPDGRLLAYTEIRNGSGDVMLLPMEGDEKTGLTPGTPRALIASAARESNPAFSPDGQWLAYQSNESSISHVYVVAVADPTRKRQVSTVVGSQPMWSKATPELLFRGDGSASEIMSATYTTTGGRFQPSAPVVWAPSRFSLRSGINDFALHPDGQRIAGAWLSTGSAPAEAEPLVVLVTNFFAQLKAATPAGR